MLFGKTSHSHWSAKLQLQCHINWLFMSDAVTFLLSIYVSKLIGCAEADLFIGCISMLIDLYCLWSIGLLGCCSMVIEFCFSVRGKQHLRQEKCLWMSWSISQSPCYSCSLSSLPATFWLLLPLLASTLCFVAYLYLAPVCVIKVCTF